ncbi:hypothetical protein FACS1894125_5160 [Actinomycetota bacterium]|nr:hypothetical protein FACS1894125_5160 [Actinomycetota bacterium]
MKNIGKVKLNAVHKVLALIFMLAIVGTLCLANTPINAHGAQSGENDQSPISLYENTHGKLNRDLLYNFDRDQPDNGLVRDGSVHDGFNEGTVFNVSDPEHYSHFAKNVMILTRNADQIKSETDLEKYFNDRNTKNLTVMFESTALGPEIIAIWNNHGRESGILPANPYDDYPQVVKDRFGYTGPTDLVGAAMLRPSLFKENVDGTMSITEIDSSNVSNASSVSDKVGLGDPDGDCGGAYICFHHDDGGYTGFHSAVSYYGRWNYVNQIDSQNYNNALIGLESGQIYEMRPNYSTRFNDSEVVISVSIS